MRLAIPAMSKSRDHSELQDMYRRALAASWAAQPGELAADQCIEDIFNGGDGWKEKKHHEVVATPRITQEDSASASGDEQNQRRSHHHRTKSGSSTKSQTTITGKSSSHHMGHKHSRSRDSVQHATGIQSPQTETSSENSERGRSGFKKAHEVDEFEVRDDLVAWRLPGLVPA